MERRRRIIAVLLHSKSRVAPVNGGWPANRWYKGRAHGVDVGAGVDAPARPLLGSHVVRRSQKRTGVGHRQRLAVDDVPGEPEVGDLDAIVKKQDVARLDVAVNDSAFVSLHQAAGDAGHDRKGFRHIEPRFFLEQLIQAFTGDEFEHEVGDAVILVVFEQVDDVGIVGLGQQPGFLAKAPENRRVLGLFAPQDLDGDDGTVGRVEGAIDDSLPAFAQLLEQAIASQRIGRRLRSRESRTRTSRQSQSFVAGHDQRSRRLAIVRLGPVSRGVQGRDSRASLASTSCASGRSAGSSAMSSRERTEH